jgi:hypothetical protein
MASTGKIWTALFLGVALWANCGQAQTVSQPVAQPSQEALRAMTELAGVIFTGQVVAVREHSAANGSSGVVEIEFAVEDAVRGVSGSSYTLREWAGLWPGGDAPFRVGQQYLMLLHSPGASGLSSPVGGMDGAIPIRGGAAADGRVVDLSWVRTRVVTPTAYAQTPSRGPIGGPINVQARVVNGDSGVAAAKVGVAIAPIEGVSASAQQSTAYAAVLGMLRSWETGDHGAR